MLNSNGQISKWVLALEWLVCFAPLTLLWGVAVSFIVSRENILLETIVQTSVATLAPIALIVSMAATFAGSGARFTRFARPLAIGFALVSMLMGNTLPGWTSTVVIVAAVGAVQLLALGILGEYVGRTYAAV